MRRQLAVLWLAVILWLTGLAGLCLAQSPSPPPDIPLLTQKAQAGDPAAMIALGEAYLDGNGLKRDLDKAIGWFATATQTNDVQAIYLLSFALRERAKPGDLDEALRYGIAALALVRKRPGLASTEANIQSQLGFTYEKLGRFEEAVVAYGAARRIFERLLGRNHPQVAGAYMNLATGLAGAGRNEDSLAANETALQLFIRLSGSDSALTANLYLNKGIGLLSLARYGEALDALDKAQVIFLKRDGPNATGVADALKTKSRVYSLLTRYPEAVEAAQSALAIYAKAPSSDQRTLAATRGMLGLAYQGLQRYDEARAQYRTAIGIYESNYGASAIEMAHPLINLGNIDDDLGQFEDALSNYEKVLVVILSTFGPDHAETATMLARMGNTSRKLGRYDAALAYGFQAFLIQAGAPDAELDSRRYTYRLLAQTLAAKGNKGAAILFAKQAVNTHQSVRASNAALTPEFRLSLGETFQRSYRLLSEQLLADGQFSEAQFASGLLKQEEFYKFIEKGNSKSSPAQDVEPDTIRLTKAEEKLWTELTGLMQPEHRIASELRTLMARREKTGKLSPEDQVLLADLTKRREAIVREFVATAPDLIDRNQAERLLRQKESLELGQHYTQKLQADLNSMGPGVVLLQAMSLEDGLHLFVSATGHDTAHREVSVRRADLADQVFAAVSAVESRSDDAAGKLAKLYDLLIRPVRAELDAASAHDGATSPALLLDLSGFLRYVPFAALYDGQRYLVEDYALALYNPATNVKFAPATRANIKAAGFGVTREHKGFSALPGAGRELEAVFRGNDGIGIIDGMPQIDEAFDEASLAKALAARPQILHIASHFRFRPGNEINSYLLLGNGDGLTLNQLRTQKKFRFRGVDLLTLSACETARGGGAEGEEIESFGALAQANGASSVMSTLWQISDESTARLMSDFYDGLVNQGLDKASALRRAQIAMIKGEAANAVALQSSRAMSVIEAANPASGTVAAPNSHPYYWAAFILMGNWK